MRLQKKGMAGYVLVVWKRCKLLIESIASFRSSTSAKGDFVTTPFSCGHLTSSKKHIYIVLWNYYCNNESVLLLWVEHPGISENCFTKSEQVSKIRQVRKLCSGQKKSPISSAKLTEEGSRILYTLTVINIRCYSRFSCLDLESKYQKYSAFTFRSNSWSSLYCMLSISWLYSLLCLLYGSQRKVRKKDPLLLF